MNKLSYQKPAMQQFGTVADLTRASGDNVQQDSIFFNGVLVGNLTGSLDACVSNNPQSPGGTCNATP